MIKAAAAFDPPQARAWLERFGDGDLIAASTFQPGLEAVETSYGRWAFQRVGPFTMTLGGPLCAPGDRRALLERLLALDRRPFLAYVRAPLLDDLDGTGLFAAGIGMDRHVDVPRLCADPPRPVRGACRKAKKAGVTVERLDLRHPPPGLAAQIADLTAAYLAQAACSVEMRFLNQPMSLQEDGLRRVYGLYQGGPGRRRLFGYVALNPIFEQGRLQAFLLDILRFAPSRIWGLWLSVVAAIAEELSKEGLGLSLGYCPLHQPMAAPRGGSLLLQAQVDGLARALGPTPYLQHLRERKALIPGQWEQRFVVSPTRFAPLPFALWMEAMGVGLRRIAGPGLLPILAEGLGLRPAAAGGPR